MPLSRGDRIGHYEILDPIGAGGMGEVYRARDTQLKRDVAVKVLPEAFANNPERLARFQREAEVLASLNHPNIATIHGMAESALVMEFVEGESPQGPMSFDRAWGISSQIAAALEYAHDKGVVHRDLKPANVKVTPDGVVKLLDFGLAKAFAGPAAPPASDPANSPTLTAGATQIGMILGTAAYMAPEQAKGKTVDKRADIWAFGVVLYELITGEKLFQGEDVSETLAHVLTKEPDLGKAPVEVHALLRHCLEKDPRKRLRDIGDAQALVEVWRPALPADAPRKPWLAWSVAGALAIALSAAMWAPWRPRDADPPASRFVILPPDKMAFRQETMAQAISPDGRLLVFLASPSGQPPSLWLRPLDSLAARPLAGTEDAAYPFWSPDNRSVGFFARGKLLRIDVANGPAQTLADAPSPLGGTWSPSGVIVYSPRPGVLYRVPAEGGEAVPIIYGEGLGVLRFPWFLPDGRHFLFSRMSSRLENSSVYMGSLDSPDFKEVKRVTPPAVYAALGYLLFRRQNTLVAQAFDWKRLSTSGDPSVIAEDVGAFGVSESGTLVFTAGFSALRRLLWVDRNGTPIADAGPPADFSNLALSPDGKRVAFDNTSTNHFEIWMRDLERGITSRLTFQPSNGALWSPDGATVVFASVGSVVDLAQRPSDMSAPESPLVKLSAQPILFPADWSPDGRYLLYYRSDPETQLDLWLLPMIGDRQPVPFLHSPGNESQGQFSPDGKWLAYVSDELGTPQINVVAFPTAGGVRQVSTAGGSQPRWQRDGKELYYVALDRKMMSVRVTTGATFDAETPRPLFETQLPVAPMRQGYGVSPDGKRFLLTVPVEVASPPMTIIQNWSKGIKR